MEQNAIYLMKRKSVLRKLQLFKATSSNFYYYFAGLARFDIKGHNHQNPPLILVPACIFLTQRHVEIRILWCRQFLLRGAR